MTQATGAADPMFGYRTDDRAEAARGAFYGPETHQALDSWIGWALRYSVDGGQTYLPANGYSLADAMRVVDGLPAEVLRRLLERDAVLAARATRS